MRSAVIVDHGRWSFGGADSASQFMPQTSFLTLWGRGVPEIHLPLNILATFDESNAEHRPLITLCQERLDRHVAVNHVVALYCCVCLYLGVLTKYPERAFTSMPPLRTLTFSSCQPRVGERGANVIR